MHSLKNECPINKVNVIGGDLIRVTLPITKTINEEAW